MIYLIYLSVEKGAWGMYLNQHAVLIVVGGTFALLAFTTPISCLKSLFKSLGELFQRERRIDEFMTDFKSLSATKRLSGGSKNPLINHAAELWEQGISSDLFVVLISQKRSELEERYLDAVQSLRNLAKYPPALGMTGTVIGMVSLFQNLGSDTQSGIGPALALAMTATFFGLIMANGIVQPLADRLHVKYLQNKRLYKNIYQILILINHGEAESIVSDEVTDRAAA